MRHGGGIVCGERDDGESVECEGVGWGGVVGGAGGWEGAFVGVVGAFGSSFLWLGCGWMG